MSAIPDTADVLLRSHPRLLPDAHKGSCGRALIVAGSERMSGAALLCARAALRSGAGLVEVALPRSCQARIAGYVPEALTLPLSEEHGAIAASAAGEIDEALARSDAIAMGPGLSHAASVARFVAAVLPRIAAPLVVDADALNILAADKGPGGGLERLCDRSAATILTPHPGEAARLLGLGAASLVNERRAAAARELAELSSAVVVLKGAATIVDDGKRSWTNSSGNSALATGGTGDVLSGILVAMLAAGFDAYEAACTAVWVHGRAADRLVEARGGRARSKRSILASDVIEELPFVWRELEVDTNAAADTTEQPR